MWAFGLDSSARQRLTAERWAQFSITPIVQRRLTLQTTGNLPVNRLLPVPVESSTTLRTLEATRQQAGRTVVDEGVREIKGARLSQMRRILNDVPFHTLDARTGAQNLLDEQNAGAGDGRP